MGLIRVGAKNFHYSIYDASAKKYGDWKAIPGLVQFTFDPQGDSASFYADDVIYETDETNGGETGNIQFAALTDDALEDLLGYVVDSTSGLTYETMDAKHASVAIGFEIGGNDEIQRCIRYSVKFSRPSGENNTKNDSFSPDTVTLPYTAIGREFSIGGETKSVIKAHCSNAGSTHTAYDNFFKSVLIPGVAQA